MEDILAFSELINNSSTRPSTFQSKNTKITRFWNRVNIIRI